ncbi:MAG TPA: ABC transporter ATP-binding protein [Leptospiraceae bacterium]|nr:ABC transporter ATP-binding protein [Leptospirales bacterium]HMU82575.1 ABC transporter ATP-binding protein [Leptospiraceae bacterium]HMX55128.1 ABC transporter ATP-binding protein [Leptospiraceae bacterium]HMY43943.1 ABC transporter ATP-binding protein [Leptospiraceae bacterium]HMZ37542.1 ABC transporter ATP-binding protein [Leptospiraceae bacterium]
MIEVKGLSRYYGDFLALDNVSIKIPPGEVVGLLGPNGAGKTTCLRILTGFLFPSSGEVLIDGVDVFSNPLESKKKIGYLPEQPPLYPELLTFDYLQFVGRLRGVEESSLKAEIERVAGLTEISDYLFSPIRTLSLGYRKRVGIAQALMGTPPFLIFDEPISGLDPRQIVEMRGLLRKIGKDHTVLISSHILTEVRHTCDRVFILHRGKLVREIAGPDLDKIEDLFLQYTST